jgi:glutamyl-tRNA reductase
MHIIATGINYRSAPVQIREKFAVEEAALAFRLNELMRSGHVREGVVLSTCNRMEIYAAVDPAERDLGIRAIQAYLQDGFQISQEAFAPYLYIKEQDRAVRHLFRVACGLDSMVIGETQILGQVKQAFLLAQQLGTTGTLFNILFKQAITLAKRAHAESSINDNPVSVSYAAVELGKRIFGGFAGKTVMIIGAGKMSELTVKHLRSGGADKVVVVNRTYAKAEELAGKFNGMACDMEHCAQYLAETDIVISSTGSKDYVLRRGDVEAAVHKRKMRPLFMIDIAVPRDLDPQISSLPNVFLYNIDDLETIVTTNLEERRQEAVAIERMIDVEMGAFTERVHSMAVGPLILAMQNKAKKIYGDTMDDLFRKLPDLSERERSVIRKLSMSIVNQMLKDPILCVKDLPAGRERDKAMELIARMFALESVKATANEMEKNSESLTDDSEDESAEGLTLRSGSKSSSANNAKGNEGWRDGVFQVLGLNR